MNLILALLVSGTVFVMDTPAPLAPDTMNEPMLEGVERTVTGSVDFPDQSAYARRVIEFAACPECASAQPFPEGDLPDE